MDPRQMKDPSAGVPAQLLPHFHLISNHKYPMMGQPMLEAIVHYLLEAPKVMRDGATVHWAFIDAPQDGTVFLEWLPPHFGEQTFSSDGYVWSGVEQAYTSEIRGYTLQMMMHPTGYKPQVENMAGHCRRRYRLLPSTQMQMSGMQPDPCLWLIHYTKSSPRDHQPVPSLSMTPQFVQQLQQRQMIQRSGQLPRKDFMFHDRSQWPVINLPTNTARSGSSTQLASGHRRGQSVAQHEATVEDEEDVSRGDTLDFMTPREMSRLRYEQHHEWMEEILESPYATKYIIPSELGLGRKGPLESLTNGFFTAPTSLTHDAVNGQVGKLPPAKAAEFTKHAHAKLNEMQAELEKMKTDHLQRMEKLLKTTDLGVAERKLRNMNVADDSYKIVAAQVQDLVGRQIEPVMKIKVLSRGGMQDIRPIVSERHMAPGNPTQQQSHPPYQHMSQVQSQAQSQTPGERQTQAPTPPSAQNNVPSSTTGAAASQATVEHTATHSSQGSGDEVRQPAVQSEATPAAQTSEQPTANADDTNTASSVARLETSDAQADTTDGLTQKDDLNMTDLVNDQDHLDKTRGQDEEIGESLGDDWDMLNDDALGSASDANIGQGVSGEDEKSPAKPVQGDANLRVESRLQPTTSTGGNNTPRGEFDMVTDFDTNMDTAGDALADYNVGDDLLDDSAFGDAFHHNEQEMS